MRYSKSAAIGLDIAFQHAKHIWQCYIKKFKFILFTSFCPELTQSNVYVTKQIFGLDLVSRKRKKVFLNLVDFNNLAIF